MTCLLRESHVRWATCHKLSASFDRQWSECHGRAQDQDMNMMNVTQCTGNENDRVLVAHVTSNVPPMVCFFQWCEVSLPLLSSTWYSPLVK